MEETQSKKDVKVNISDEDAFAKRIRENGEDNDHKHPHSKKLKIDRLMFMKTLKHLITMHDNLKRRYRVSGDLRMLCEINSLKMNINERRRAILADDELYGRKKNLDRQQQKSKRRETVKILYDRNAKKKCDNTNNANSDGGDHGTGSRIEKGLELAKLIKNNFRSALNKFKNCSIDENK